MTGAGGVKLGSRGVARVRGVPTARYGDWVSYEEGDVRFAIRPSSTGTLTDRALASSGPVPISAIDATRVAYPDAFTDATLEYASTELGFKETIVLSRSTSSTAWGFDLALNGLTPRFAKRSAGPRSRHASRSGCRPSGLTDRCKRLQTIIHSDHDETRWS